jgi:hypothetical protein
MIVEAVLKRTMNAQAVSAVGIPLAHCGLPAGDILHATVQPRAERAF